MAGMIIFTLYVTYGWHDYIYTVCHLWLAWLYLHCMSPMVGMIIYTLYVTYGWHDYIYTVCHLWLAWLYIHCMSPMAGMIIYTLYVTYGWHDYIYTVCHLWLAWLSQDIMRITCNMCTFAWWTWIELFIWYPLLCPWFAITAIPSDRRGWLTSMSVMFPTPDSFLVTLERSHDDLHQVKHPPFGPASILDWPDVKRVFFLIVCHIVLCCKIKVCCYIPA